MKNRQAVLQGGTIEQPKEATEQTTELIDMPTTTSVNAVVIMIFVTCSIKLAVV